MVLQKLLHVTFKPCFSSTYNINIKLLQCNIQFTILCTKTATQVSSEKCCAVMHAGALFCAIVAFLGASVGAVMHYMPMYICDYIPVAQYTWAAKAGLSVMPSLAMFIGCETLVHFEITGAFDLITFISVNGRD